MEGTIVKVISVRSPLLYLMICLSLLRVKVHLDDSPAYYTIKYVSYALGFIPSFLFIKSFFSPGICWACCLCASWEPQQTALSHFLWKTLKQRLTAGKSRLFAHGPFPIAIVISLFWVEAVADAPLLFFSLLNKPTKHSQSTIPVIFLVIFLVSWQAPAQGTATFWQRSDGCWYSTA